MLRMGTEGSTTQAYSIQVYKSYSRSILILQFNLLYFSSFSQRSISRA